MLFQVAQLKITSGMIQTPTLSPFEYCGPREAMISFSESAERRAFLPLLR